MEKIQDGGFKSVIESGHFVHEGDDNVDINTETIDGKNTFHSMARAVFQESGIQPVMEISRIKRKTDKSLKLTVEIEHLMQIQRYEKPIRRPEPPRYEDAIQKVKKCQSLAVPTIDLSWILVRLLSREILPIPENLVCIKHQVVPFWTGFNHILS